MRKRIALFIMVSCMSLSAWSLQANAQSIDDVVNSNQQSTEQSSEQGTEQSSTQESGFSIDTSGSALTDEIVSSGNMTDTDGTAQGIVSPLRRLVVIAVQVIAQVIPMLLPLTILIEFMYILFPIVRGKSASSSGNYSSVGGGSSFNSSYNSGYNSSYNDISSQSSGESGKAFGVWPVSGETVKIANSDMPKMEALKAFFKSSAIMCVFAGIMIVLMLTGALNRIGILCGNALANALFKVG